jgi:hypothetical protein
VLIVKRKIIAAALLSFFAWNAVFGGAEGLLLCLNKSSMLNHELMSDKGSDCPLLCVSEPAQGSVEVSSLSNDESCVDFELKAVELPQMRIDTGESAPVLTALQCNVSEVSIPNFTLKEIAHIVQAQAPPELMDTSVLVAQTVNLRL